ncbi:MAG: GTPase [Polyangiaceae bacterium]|nr:GTPase [Polyangiaceae bacterium]
MTRTKVLILGAAGRDFHDFNVVFRDDDRHEVVGFTANQIPGIAKRRYPPELAGPLYPEGIPIFPEQELERLVHRLAVDEVVLSYSDLSHETVMHLASRALSTGAGFRLLPPKKTLLQATKPVIAICAVRTGCGKSPATRYVARALAARGVKVAILRHPMPYGDLKAQRVQRFASVADLDAAGVTVEEREDYEPHIERGDVVFAGVDYEAILAEAQRECDVLLWDGGNNDLPFLRPDLWITVVDPHRPGHELSYHPGEANLRSCDVVLVNKVDSAAPSDVERLLANVAAVRPSATVVQARSEVTADDPSVITAKRVLLIEDGPTLTHGQMAFGAGRIAAGRLGAAMIVDPRSAAVGSIAQTYEKYPHIGAALPAMGYSEEQVRDLEATIARVDCDSVVIATPTDLRHILKIDKPSTRVRYELGDHGSPTLGDVVRALLERSS